MQWLFQQMVTDLTVCRDKEQLFAMNSMRLNPVCLRDCLYQNHPNEFVGLYYNILNEA